MILDKVLDDAGGSCIEMVAADEMGGELMFRLPRTVLAVGHGAVGAVDAVDSSRHDVVLGSDHAPTERVLRI